MALEKEHLYYELLNSQLIESLLKTFYDETGLLANFCDLQGWVHKSFFPDKKGNPFCGMIHKNSFLLSRCMNEPGKRVKEAVCLKNHWCIPAMQVLLI